MSSYQSYFRFFNRKRSPMGDTSVNKATTGHSFGNFHQYYSFHKAEDRISLLPSDFFNDIWQARGQRNTFSLLDIGCNDGTLTWALFQQIRKDLPDHVTISILGIDLDSELIDRANSCFVTNENANNIKFKTLNIMDQIEEEVLYGTFDIVCLFSITMWVHLNHGDEGFLRFIQNAAKYSSHSLLIEPQRWKSYRSAVKRSRKLGLPNFPFNNGDLTLKDIDGAIRDTLISSECGMLECKGLGTDSWERPLLLYQRPINRENVAVPITSSDTKRAKLN